MNFKWRHFNKQIILTCIRWYLAYPLSYRHIEEMMQERGLRIDHATINHWVIKYFPQLEENFRKHRKQVGGSWRLDETYIKVKGKWKYLYRAVDKAGNTVDFLLTTNRDKKSARRFLVKAIESFGVPIKINIDKSGANNATIKSYNDIKQKSIEIRQVKYLNNIVEQDHRAIKRMTRPMMGFKSFWAATNTLAGIGSIGTKKSGDLLSSFNERPIL